MELNTAKDIVLTLHKSLVPLMFMLFIIGWIVSMKDKDEPLAYLRYIILLTLLTILSMNIFSIFQPFNDGLMNLADDVRYGSNLDIFKQLIFIDVEDHDSWTAPMSWIASSALNMMRGMAILIHDLFLSFSTLLAYMVLSLIPIICGFMAIPQLANTGLRAMQTIFSVAMWPVAFLVADIAFIGLLDYFAVNVIGDDFRGIGDFLSAFADAPEEALAPAEGFLLAGFFMVQILLYLIAPLLITIVLSGGNPAGAIAGVAGATVGMFSAGLGAAGAAASKAGMGMSGGSMRAGMSALTSQMAQLTAAMSQGGDSGQGSSGSPRSAPKINAPGPGGGVNRMGGTVKNNGNRS